MAIPGEEVAQVRAATDIVELIGGRAALRRQGRRWVGLCPFHPEKTPSFSVNPEAGVYYCFGCRESGDAISFVRATEHLEFADAVRWLADRAGIALHDDDVGGADRLRRRELFEAMERAVAWYHERLLQAPDAGRARDYLRSRGYDGDLVRRFRLGWAPDGWDELSRSLGVPSAIFEATGLGFVNRRGRMQDALRGRVLFPIFDPSGRAVALGGRVLPPEPPGEPKYKNSPETAIYSKRRTLYGLNWAKQDIVASGEVVVCEGYTDVIGCFQVGVPRAVATCGTALAEEHFQLLRNFGRRIVLAYDADAAGQNATARVYEWERRHEVDVTVAGLPAGSDPGELARRDPDVLRDALGGARPFLELRVARAIGEDLSTPEARARAAERALLVIAEHPVSLVRDQYLMSVADRCRLAADSLRPVLQQALRRRGARSQRDETGLTRTTAGSSAAKGGPTQGGSVDDAGPEREALRFMVHDRPAIAPRLHEVLFGDDVERRAFGFLAGGDDLHAVIDRAQAEAPSVADLLRQLAVQEPTIPEEALGDPVNGVIVQLVRRAARRALDEQRARARMSPAHLADAGRDTAYLQFWLARLQEPAHSDEAAEQLVAWLTERDDASQRPT